MLKVNRGRLCLGFESVHVLVVSCVLSVSTVVSILSLFCLLILHSNRIGLGLCHVSYHTLASVLDVSKPVLVVCFCLLDNASLVKHPGTLCCFHLDRLFTFPILISSQSTSSSHY